MGYWVPVVTIKPPDRVAALIGGASALGGGLSPLLIWWQHPLGHSLTIGGVPGIELTNDTYGIEVEFGRLVILFGLISLGFWLYYGRGRSRRSHPTVARLLLYLFIAFASGICATAIQVVRTRHGLPGLYEADRIGIGLYGLIGASLVQTCCLIWLLGERIKNREAR